MAKLTITGLAAANVTTNPGDNVGFGYVERDRVTGVFPIKTSKHSLWGMWDLVDTGSPTANTGILSFKPSETTGVSASPTFGEPIPSDLTITIEGGVFAAGTQVSRSVFNSVAQVNYADGTGIAATPPFDVNDNASFYLANGSEFIGGLDATDTATLQDGTEYIITIEAENIDEFTVYDLEGTAYVLNEQNIYEAFDGFTILLSEINYWADTTTLASLTSEIMPMVIGVPKLYVEKVLRQTAIDFCEQSEVLQEEVLVSAIASVYDYPLVATDAALVPHKILWASFNGNIMEPISAQLVESRYTKWRDSTSSPEVYYLNTPTTMRVVPIPNAAGVNNIVVSTILKPSSTATTLPERLITDYREELINGTVYRLLRMPNVEWSDPNSAQLYRTLYEEGLVTAKRRAKQQDTGIARCAKYGGIGGSNTRSKLRRLRW